MVWLTFLALDLLIIVLSFTFLASTSATIAVFRFSRVRRSSEFIAIMRGRSVTRCNLSRRSETVGGISSSELSSLCFCSSFYCSLASAGEALSRFCHF